MQAEAATPTVTLDTSGAVEGPIGAIVPGAVMLYRWPNLDPFTQGAFEEAARQAVVGGMAPEAVAFRNWSPEAVALILSDCAARVAGWHAANSAVRSDDRTEGQRFWRDRQAGLCADSPPLTVSLGGDGKIHPTNTPA